MSTLLGQHVVPVAEILLQELKQAAQELRTFGEAFLNARRHALAKGYLVALALVADENFDWRISSG